MGHSREWSTNTAGPLTELVAGGYMLCDIRGQAAIEVWTIKDMGRLYQHLHNSNGPFDYVMGFQDGKTGEKRYVRSKSKSAEQAISWALATVQGRQTPEKSLAFVPYSTNANQMSRWGCLDFDAHNGETERARAFAFAAFRLLLNCESATILESSGSGGWHVWSIARDFKPVSHWIRLLKGVARDIGAPVQSGVCEIFPPDTLSRGFGKGMRAPGAWNPGTNTYSEIWWQNADPLISELPPFDEVKSRRIGKLADSFPAALPIEKKLSLSMLPFSSLGILIRKLDSFRISHQATRHDQLCNLVGILFYQVSRTVAEHYARAQFLEKTTVTNAGEAEHLDKFTDLWDGLEKPWLASLGAAEREHFARLCTDAERGAFRIIRSYAHKADEDDAADFPIVCANLGERLAISIQGASQMRQKFAGLGILAQTVPYRANVSAARYRWLLTDASDSNHPF